MAPVFAAMALAMASRSSVTRLYPPLRHRDRGALPLHGGRIIRHHDDSRHAQHLRRRSDTLRVIAEEQATTTRRPRLGRDLHEAVIGAPELE